MSYQSVSSVSKWYGPLPSAGTVSLNQGITTPVLPEEDWTAKFSAVSGLNSVFKIYYTGVVAEGTFIISVDGQDTNGIDYNDSAFDIRTELEALSNLDAGDINVWITDDGTISTEGQRSLFIELTGYLAQSNQLNITVDGTNLLGVNPGVICEQVQVGVPEGQGYQPSSYIVSPVNGLQAVTIAESTGGTFTLEYDSQVTSGIAYDATAATIETALEGLSTIGAGNVNVYFEGVDALPNSTFYVEFIGDLAGQPTETLIGDATSLTSGTTATIDVSVIYDGRAVQFVSEPGSTKQHEQEIIYVTRKVPAVPRSHTLASSGPTHSVEITGNLLATDDGLDTYTYSEIWRDKPIEARTIAWE